MGRERTSYQSGQFNAMGSPCELLMTGVTESEFHVLLGIARNEAIRIEHKFSRYRDDNIVHAINHANGTSLQVDEETARLLNYADTCFQLSDGMFDITSGVLRKIWSFTPGQQRVPSDEEIASTLNLIGWHKVSWRLPEITLSKGMEIDLGGIGKEYAADRIHDLIAQQSKAPFLINLGGDIRCGNPAAGYFWQVGIENPRNDDEQHADSLRINAGAIATSGDTYRFFEHEGQRYGHILNPKTGRPVEQAPRSVTVLADNCTEAGMLATFAMLHGEDAETFLESQGVQFKVLR